MVIQLTQHEMAILEQAALGRPVRRNAAGAAADRDLALLLDMQLVVQTAGRLQITAIGQRVLKMARDDPRRV